MDSSRPAGAFAVRFNGIIPRLLAYESGTVNIDLRIAQIPSSSRVALVGQVLELAEPNQIIADARVAAVCEDEEIHKTTTNKFGEFQLECEYASPLYLTVQIARQEKIWVLLNRPIREPSQGIWT